jgi:hypothetical protein
MSVASCRSIFLLSDVVSNRVSISFQFSIHDLMSIRGRASSGFSARPVARAGPALAARAQAPHSPMRPLLSLSFFFSHATTSLSLSSTSLALGVIRWTVVTDRQIPRRASPPSPLSLLPLPFPCARPVRPSPAASPTRPSLHVLARSGVAPSGAAPTRSGEAPRARPPAWSGEAPRAWPPYGLARLLGHGPLRAPDAARPTQQSF